MQLRGGRARSGPEFFGMWLYDKETEVGRDVSFWGAKHTELSNRAGSGGLPRRRSPALHFGAPGARQGQVLFDARLGRSTSSCTNTKCSSSPVMSSASWCIVWGDTGTRGTVVLLRCFLLLPCHRVLHSRSRRCLLRPAPHVEGVVQARKKKCGFMV